MKISLCLLVWNELTGCKIDVPHLPLYNFDEVYAVDGGSTDGTVEYLTSQNIPVYRQPRPGLNAAYIHAEEKSSCDAVVIFFPKGTLSPDTLLRFRPLLEEGYDLVIASRNIPGARNEEDNNWLRPRKWCVRLLAFSVALVWRREGNVIRDVLHGVKGFTRASFKKMLLLGVGPSVDLEMVVRSYRLRFPRIEFPVQEGPRLHGETHFKVWPTGRALLKYLRYELTRK
jgi:glycosyltransferase involved in cell wall biosynthesis